MYDKRGLEVKRSRQPARSGTLLHFAYSTISDSHCPFHFDALAKYEIDHVSVTASAYGAMLYNADMGPNTISNSNFQNSGAHDLEQTAPNSLLKLDNVFLGSNNSTYAGGKAIPGANISIKNKPVAPVANAKPR